MNYKQAAEFIIQRRRAELDAAAALFSDALLASPALYETEQALRGLILTEAKTGKTDKTQKTALECRKKTILKQLGLTDKVLNPPPFCKKCGDTAVLKDGYCTCVKAQHLNDKQNLEIPCTAFSKINYTLFDAIHRARNQTIYADIQKICEKYPGNKRKITIIFGGVGTGKTLLAGCAVTAFIERGFTAAAVTAFGFVARALKYHTTFDNEKFSHLQPLLDSDLLVIDDLGTESVLKNITYEYLLNILNERVNSGKLTFITTNLSREGILDRYGERIYSRLFDKELAYTNILNGKDLRGV